MSVLSRSAGELTRHLAHRKRVVRRGRIRQLIFGSLDGLLVPLGVVSAVAGGTGDSKAVIVAGIAEAFAGALSMGSGEFMSGRSEAQVHEAEVAAELEEMRADPVYELEEMAQLFCDDGMNDTDAMAIADILARNPRAYAKTMVEKELGIPLEPESMRTAEGLTMSGSYLASSIVPLVAYFFLPVKSAFFASLGLTLLAFVGLGLVKGKLANLKILPSVAEILLVGAVSGVGGYFLGVLVPHLFGY